MSRKQEGLVSLCEASEDRFGGKAARLALAIRAGLPVPPGVVLAFDTEVTDEVLWQIREQVEGPFAVRSSAVGEDGSRVSFAGQFLSLMNVSGEKLKDAIDKVRASADSEGVRAYQRRLGVEGRVRMGVIVQTFIPSDLSGVLFETEGRLRVEAAWGLGEAVVGGVVTPDSFLTNEIGEVVQYKPGNQDRIIVPSEEGVQELPLPPLLGRMVGGYRVRQLWELADQVRGAKIFDASETLDLEWAFLLDVQGVLRQDRLFLLQARPGK